MAASTFRKIQVKQGVPSDEDLEWLSDHVERWKVLGRRLQIEEGRLLAIDTEHWDMDEKAYQMLRHWKIMKGSAATYRVLHDALCHPLVNRRDLAPQLWEYSNLPQFTTVKQGVPSDKDLEWLSHHVPQKWKVLGSRLRIEEGRLLAIDTEHRDMVEKAYQMLRHWKIMNGSDATYRVLHDALCHPLVSRRDLAEQLWEYSNLPQFTTGPIPYHIKARGTMGLEAYRRALEIGETFDRRTKIALIGQDRVGKTSLRKYLRGEAFDKDEASTPGIEMMSPVKNAGTGAWENPAPLENTSLLDHKLAEVVAKELLSSPKKRQQSAQPLPGEGERGEPTSGKRATQEHSNVFQGVKNERKPKEVPEKVLSLIDHGLTEKYTSDNEDIWPFVWDFAGQAVYHAIHPIFLSQEAICVLVSDLSKELSAPAQCRMRPPNHDEIEVNSPYVEDTNLDHMMRWLDLVHSLGRPEFQRKSANIEDILPRVVLVGTHADGVRDPCKEMESVMRTICSVAHPATLGHISKEFFFIDNANPNRKDDPKIVSLRAELLNLARKMPHINKVIPMQWLRVEQKVDEMVKKGMHYIGKKRFAEDISGGICQFNGPDDVEELLHFLQARGRVIYHDLAENPDGLVVLDPQWLIKILCEIITVSPSWKNDPIIKRDYQVLRKKGLLSQQLLNQAFEHLELNDRKDSLIRIMESFDVICNSKNCKGKDYPYFVPCMLKSPKKNTRGTDMRNGPLPVFLTFNTNYVPSGLFCRLVVLFWEWASQLCGSCTAPSLFSNAARFKVSEEYQLTLECHKTVIELKIWTLGNSNKTEEERICEELLSHLKHCRTRLSVNCSWLRSVTMELFVKCRLCEPCPDKCPEETNICILHKKEGCSHFDCGHYIPLRSLDLSCEHSVDAVPFPAEKLDPWFQALKSPGRKKRTDGSTKHLPRPKVKRRNEESSPSDALTSKKRKTGLAGASTKHLRRSKVKRRNEESSPSDALTSKKRKTGFAGGSMKHFPRPKVKRRNEESSPSDALTSKKRKSGFAGGSTKHLRRSKVKRRNEESSPSDALTSNKRKTEFAGGSTKHLPRPKVKRRDEESSPCDALTPNKRKSGFAVKQGVPSDGDLLWLSHKLENWEELGHLLKIEEATLTEIDHDYRRKRKKIYKMLQHWKQASGAAATYMVLHHALCHPLVGRTDLAEQYCCQPRE